MSNVHPSASVGGGFDATRGLSDAELMAAANVDALEIRQLVAPPFAVLKLFPNTLHRGIANGENYDRFTFCICTAPRAIDIGERSLAYEFGSHELQDPH